MREFHEEDPQFYGNILRFDACKFDELLSAVEDEIRKQRLVIPARCN